MPRNLLDCRFELLVDLLGAADEADAGHAVAPAVERLVGGGDHLGMIGQAEVVVGAEIQHRLLIEHADPGVLRRGDNPLALEEAGVADLLELIGEIVLHRAEHGYALQILGLRSLNITESVMIDRDSLIVQLRRWL